MPDDAHADLLELAKEIAIEAGEILLFSEKTFIGIGISDGEIIKPVRLIRSKIN